MEQSESENFAAIHINASREDESLSRRTAGESLDSNASADNKGSQLETRGPSHIAINRDEFLQAYKDLKAERNKLQIKNNLLHKKLAEFYKKRKMEHVLKRIENAPELEEKYRDKLLAYERMKLEGENEIADIKLKISMVRNHCENKSEFAEKEFEKLQDHERHTGTGLIYSNKGRPISEKTVARMLELQKDKTLRMSDMMLRYIRVRNAVTEQEAIIRSLDRIGPGLHVAQFERMQLEHNSCLNKFEEREDEIIRNRKRCNNDTQILSHIREKLHYVDEYIEIMECNLGDVEIECQRARAQLAEVKTRRDQLRIAKEQERLKAGLLARRDLLYDFQESAELLARLKERKEDLKKQIDATNRKLREARASMENGAINKVKIGAEDDCMNWGEDLNNWMK